MYLIDFHQKQVSDEDVANNYSGTRDWASSVVRCLAWHPQAAKIALALRDDTIHVSGNDLQVQIFFLFEMWPDIR